MLKCTRTMVNIWFKFGQTRTQLTKLYSLFFKESCPNPAKKWSVTIYFLVRFENWAEKWWRKNSLTMHVMNIYTHFLYVPRAKSYFRNICWNLKLGSYYDTQIWFQNSNSMLDRRGKMTDFKTRYLQDCSVRYSRVRRSNFHVVSITRFDLELYPRWSQMLHFSEKLGHLPRPSASRYFWWLAFVDQPLWTPSLNIQKMSPIPKFCYQHQKKVSNIKSSTSTCHQHLSSFIEL